jgi:hypothetical protein
MILPIGTAVAVADGERVRLFHNTGVKPRVITAAPPAAAYSGSGARHSVGNLQGAQMILFPLIMTWMWFQTLNTSSIPTFVSRRRGHQHAEVSWRTVAFEGG